MENVISDSLNTAKTISDVGLTIVAAAFFLVISAGILISNYKWIKITINNMINVQQKTMSDLIDETRAQNEKLDDIAEGLKVETQLRVKTISSLVFDLGIENAIKMVERVKTENHIINKEATELKIKNLCANMHEDRNSKLDCFTYRGKKLSSYTSTEWIDWVTDTVRGEVYSDHEPRLVRTNIETVYARIKLEFYKNINL